MHSLYTTKRRHVGRMIFVVLVGLAALVLLRLPQLLKRFQVQTPYASPQLQRLAIQSAVLEKQMRINVYLPEQYEAGKRYPVLYLLHGLEGNEDEWLGALRAGEVADRLAKEGRIQPLIIVAPQLDNSYGMNSSREPRTVKKVDVPAVLNEGMYKDYLYKEVIPHIDQSYPTIAAREGRFIGGLSMGGLAALHLAVTQPELISKVGGHSPALFVDTSRGIGQWLYPSPEVQRQRDPIHLAPDRDLSGLKVYLDCGDRDSWGFAEGSHRLFEVFSARGVDVKYDLKPGGHNDDYWRANIEDYLLFYCGNE